MSMVRPIFSTLQIELPQGQSDEAEELYSQQIIRWANLCNSLTDGISNDIAFVQKLKLALSEIISHLRDPSINVFTSAPNNSGGIIVRG